MNYQTQQKKLRDKHGLPATCECGGRMEYEFSMGRIWSHCKKCTPVVTVDLEKIKEAQRQQFKRGAIPQQLLKGR